jgi:hypothetical protein
MKDHETSDGKGVLGGGVFVPYNPLATRAESALTALSVDASLTLQPLVLMGFFDGESVDWW